MSLELKFWAVTAALAAATLTPVIAFDVSDGMGYILGITYVVCLNALVEWAKRESKRGKK